MYRIRILSIVFFVLLGGLSFHELGHVFASYLTGGSATDFVVLSLRPHVRLLGAATPVQEAFRAGAGTACSLLASFLFLIAAPSRCDAWRLARFMTGAFAGVELLGWSLSCLMRTHSPSPDDAELLLAASGANAVLIALSCVVIGLCGALVIHLRERGRREQNLATAADC